MRSIHTTMKLASAGVGDWVSAHVVLQMDPCREEVTRWNAAADQCCARRRLSW